VFSFYYRKILAKEILAIPRRGALNLHGSLLPKYRGRCPLNWVLIHDESETGVTLHYMEEKPDRGDIVAQGAVRITDDDTALTLFDKLTGAAATLLRDTYPLLCAGTAPRRAQDHAQASYFGGRRPEDGRIDWSQSDRQVFNLVRAVTRPYPGAFTHLEGRTLYVWKTRLLAAVQRVEAAPGTVLAVAPELEIHTGRDPIRLTRVQFDNGAEMSGRQLAEQYALSIGVQLT
jgi:methionyl-tRNA formyltransferase